jgi:hypothetical protein
MYTTKQNRLLYVFLLAAVVTLFAWRTSKTHPTPICQKETPSLHDAGTQLLWESLSRQFVSIQAY